MKPLVFVCQPRYSSQVYAPAMQGLISSPTRGLTRCHWGDAGGGSPMQGQSSLLEYTFNELWCMALNLRETYQVSYFAMLHADIEPQPGWVDILVSELQRVGGDVISAVVPFKDATGRTSTGIGEPHWPEDRCHPREHAQRLTLHEVHQLPETFSAAEACPGKVLLLNTGCMVLDFRKPWIEDFTWEMHSLNYRDPTGRWRTTTRGEDWGASLRWHRLGLKTFATRKVHCVHHGDFGFANGPQPWGQWPTDHDHARFVSDFGSVPEAAQPSSE